jgi:hypothetical protein
LRFISETQITEQVRGNGRAFMSLTGVSTSNLGSVVYIIAYIGTSRQMLDKSLKYATTPSSHISLYLLNIYKHSSEITVLIRDN